MAIVRWRIELLVPPFYPFFALHNDISVSTCDIQCHDWKDI